MNTGIRRNRRNYGGKSAKDDALTALGWCGTTKNGTRPNVKDKLMAQLEI
jgi:hypothetical protein